MVHKLNVIQKHDVANRASAVVCCINGSTVCKTLKEIIPFYSHLVSIQLENYVQF